MRYAVIASGGKQYKVSEGSVVELEKLKVEEGSEINFDNILLLSDEGTVTIGQPTLTNVTITAKVLGQIKARKIRVAKFKAKARYRKVYGHRQHLTKVQIGTISVKAVKETKEKAKSEAKSTEKAAKE